MDNEENIYETKTLLDGNEYIDYHTSRAAEKNEQTEMPNADEKDLYSCKVCGQKFNRAVLVKLHMLVHTNKGSKARDIWTNQ